MVDKKNIQAEKDRALAKKMGRVPLLRHPGENDREYSARLRLSPKLPPQLTEEQIKLARDMHAVHSAMARGYVLPPLPVSDEQRASDEVWAQERGVQPVLREPGETDEEYLARLDASPPIEGKQTPIEDKDASGAPNTTYPSHVDKPVFAPIVHGPQSAAGAQPV